MNLTCHSESFGSLGLMGQLGFVLNSGNGVFTVNLAKPGGVGGNYGTQSQVKFQLFTLPLTVGAVYRFNLLKYLRPYVMAGPTYVGFYELRNDNAPSNHAAAHSITFGGGVAISLDWISKSASWDMYTNSGVKQMYFTLDYGHISSFSGPIDYSSNGFSGGFAFEF